MPKSTKRRSNWQLESEHTARLIIRTLHPTVPPKTSDVRGIAHLIRMFARKRMIDLFGELQNTLTKHAEDDREGR